MQACKPQSQQTKINKLINRTKQITKQSRLADLTDHNYFANINEIKNQNNQ